ncbi:putative protein OS=Streptomyces microflavus OX=1919 GN=Smic_60020 PE=4 SV=1 [Streptomyces microflavus]
MSTAGPKKRQGKILPLYKPRLYTITSEAGSTTVPVTYLPCGLRRGRDEAQGRENTKRC